MMCKGEEIEGAVLGARGLRREGGRRKERGGKLRSRRRWSLRRAWVKSAGEGKPRSFGTALDPRPPCPSSA